MAPNVKIFDPFQIFEFDFFNFLFLKNYQKIKTCFFLFSFFKMRQKQAKFYFLLKSKILETKQNVLIEN